MSYHCHCPDMAVVLMKLNCRKEVQFPEWDKMTDRGSLLGDKRKKLFIYFTTVYVMNC